MGNRLRMLRKRAKLTQAALAELVNTTNTEISKLELGERDLAKWAGRLARVLNCTPADLMNGESEGLSVPIVYTVGLAASDRIAEPAAADPVPRTSRPDALDPDADYVAVRVGDDSVNRMYPAGSTLFVRPADQAPLHLGDKIVVKRFATDRAAGEIFEVLAGRLGRTNEGALVVLIKSTNRHAPHSVVIREAHGNGEELAERFITYTAPPEGDEIFDYSPANEDPAEIVGVIKLAQTLE